MSTGRRATAMPFSRKALIFSSAVPEEPLMMAPACPMRRPGGAGLARDEADDRKIEAAREFGRLLFVRPPDFSDHHNRPGLSVPGECLEAVDEGGADDGIPPDADARGLADAGVGELSDGLIGKRSGTRHHADGAETTISPEMIPTVALPGEMTPGQLGPSNRTPWSETNAWARVMSSTGMPSVMQTISWDPDSAASMIALAAKGGGT